MCEWEPSSWADLRRYLGIAREEFYLDGPNDVDWILPNQILHSRESNMYVDYVKSGDTRTWLVPSKYERGLSHYTPRVLSVVAALQGTRCIAPSALARIATIWRPFVIDDIYPRQALHELNHHMLSLNWINKSSSTNPTKLQSEYSLTTYLFRSTIPIYARSRYLRMNWRRDNKHAISLPGQRSNDNSV